MFLTKDKIIPPLKGFGPQLIFIFQRNSELSNYKLYRNVSQIEIMISALLYDPGISGYLAIWIFGY